MKIKNLKVALVHDYIKEYGGAERVLEVLHELYPDAPVFTTVYCPEFLGPHKDRFNSPAGKWDIRTSIAQYLPFKEKLISPLRLVAPFLFKQFDFSNFDVVIVSATGAYCPNIIRIKDKGLRIKDKGLRIKDKGLRIKDSKENQRLITKDQRPIHICYCHTPPRYLYGYATARDWKKNIVWRVLGELANHFLRLIDYKSSQNVDLFIANSEEVKARIKKFYRKDAVVVYPPVTIASSKLASSVQLKKIKLDASNLDARRYYLCGGRLARAKHIDLIVRACQELNLNLKVFGRGFAGYEEELDSMINDKGLRMKNVEFLGEVTDEEKFELMQNAKAYIFAGEDEDFGILPVEAMGCGTPVIAYRSGGVKETIIDRKTGLFFDELSVASLKKAINELNDIVIKPEDCIKQASKFSKENFMRKIKALVR